MPSVWTGAGYADAPTFNASDFGWYDYALADGSTKRMWGMLNGGNGTGWNSLHQYSPNYQLFDNVDPTYSQEWLTEGPEGSLVRNPNYDPNWAPTNFSVRVKSGEKAGSAINYVLRDGQFVPEGEFSKPTYWDTNPGKQNMDLLKLAATAVGGAFMGPALEGAGAAISAGSMPTVSQMGTIANLVNTGSGGQIPGLNLAGAATGGYGALTNLAGGSGSFMDAIRLLNSGNSLYNGVTNLVEGESGGVPDARQRMGGSIGAGGGSGMDWLSQLFNMGGAMYSANKNDNYADDMRRMYSERMAERQPFVDRLEQFRRDPNAWLQGPQGQAIADVAANRFTRNDARSGNLANDVGRTNLLNKHMLTEMDKHGQSLASDLTHFDTRAAMEMYNKSAEMDRMKNAPLFAAPGYGGAGGAGGINGILQAIKMAGGSVQDFYKWINGNGGSMPTADQIAARGPEDYRFEDLVGGAGQQMPYTAPDYAYDMEWDAGNGDYDWINNMFGDIRL